MTKLIKFKIFLKILLLRQFKTCKYTIITISKLDKKQNKVT